MKYFKNIKIALLVGLIIPIFSTAQVRPDINSISSGDRTILANLMQQYIDLDVVQMHCDYTAQGGPDIHNDFNFLPFHRLYIQGMEDFLIKEGYPQFVPLPQWDQTTCLPTELRVIDPVCSSLGSTNCGNVGSFNCNTPNWCPSNPMPNYLTTTIQSGSGNDICDWNLDPTNPAASTNCCPNGLSRKIESPYHNNGHGQMGGVMGLFTSPVLPAFWLWHAHIDDVWKSWEEACSQSIIDPVDLWMQDTKNNLSDLRDSGVEPNDDNGPMWRSEDIWIRNQPDGFTNHVHENPEHQNFSQSFVYVRIRNRGYQTSSGTEQLQLHWAKANTSLGWPAYWDGTTFVGSTVMGDVIGTQTINSVDAGDQIILEIPWSVPDPADYSFNANPQHFCLLARVLGEPMTFPEGANVNTNTDNNNNIVWKNVTVVDNDPLGIIAGGDCPDDLMESIGVSVAVSNQFNHQETFDLVFKVPESEIQTELTGTLMLHDFEGMTGSVDAATLTRPTPETAITDEGTVVLEMSNELYEKWAAGGKQGTGFVEIKSPPMSATGLANNNVNDHADLFIGDGDGKRFEVTGMETTFENITLDANQITFAAMMVIYPDNPITPDNNFVYTVQQLMTSTQALMGGVDYHINKPDCSDHSADAGADKTIDRNCTTTLQYVPTQLCDNYYWLNGNGNILATNSDVAVSPSHTTTYTLKMVSKEGCVSADDMTINTTNQNCPRKHHIIKISPNPGDVVVEVKYKLGQNVANAKLKLVNVSNGEIREFTLDVNADKVLLDLNTCGSGLYNVILNCDGVNEDSESLMMN